MSLAIIMMENSKSIKNASKIFTLRFQLDLDEIKELNGTPIQENKEFAYRIDHYDGKHIHSEFYFTEEFLKYEDLILKHFEMEGLVNIPMYIMIDILSGYQ